MSSVVRRQRLDEEYGSNQDNNLTKNGIAAGKTDPEISNAEEDTHRNMHDEMNGIELLDGEAEQASSIQAEDDEMIRVENGNPEPYLKLPVQSEPTQCSVPAPLSKAASKKMLKNSKKKLKRRKKFIKVKKRCSGYQEYIRQVPRCERQSRFKEHPMTPDANDSCISNKSWKRQTIEW